MKKHNKLYSCPMPNGSCLFVVAKNDKHMKSIHEKKLFNNCYIFDELSKRYSKDEKHIKYENLRSYEKSINDRIRNDEKYKVLHNKVIMVSAFGIIATLYYYDGDDIVVVGEVSFIPDDKWIAIKSEFKCA